MKLDVLAVGAHPDDVEIGCGGSLINLADAGLKVGVVDLTAAELSTRGDPDTREKETHAASKLLGLSERFQLRMTESELMSDTDNVRKLVRLIRETRPALVFAHAWEARHPDHRDAHELTQRAVFWAGVKRFDPGAESHRPLRTLHYFLHRVADFSLVTDVSAVFERKMQAIRTYDSQFGSKRKQEGETFISRPDFLDGLVSRGRHYGSLVGVTYGEPLFCRDMMRVDDLLGWAKSQGGVG